jgi:hypothetical protein
MSTEIDDPILSENLFFEQNLSHSYRETLQRFRKISSTFVTFNLIAAIVFSIELIAFVACLPFLKTSGIFAFTLGGLSLSCFSYFVLLFYFQSRKPQQLLDLKERFLASCRKISQNHLPLAEATLKLSNYLQDFERNFYNLPSPLQWLKTPISHFSGFCHWRDVFHFKQLLLSAVIEEHLHQIRKTPTDFETHASLANTYIALAKLYRESDRDLSRLEPNWEKKSRAVSSLALEEFKILNEYAPNDPWVHEQLALGYQGLGMAMEEIAEVEFLSQLLPHDRDVSFLL